MMNILHICENYSRGGLEDFVHEISYEYALWGHANYYCFGNDAVTQKELPAQEILHGVHFGAASQMTVGDFVSDVRLLVEFIKSHSIDLVIVHPFYSFYAAVIAAKIASVRVGYILHGVPSIAFPSNTTELTLNQLLLRHVVDAVFTVNAFAAETVDMASRPIIRVSQPIRFLEQASDVQPNNKKWALVSRLDSDKIGGIKAFLSMLPALDIDEVEIFGDGDSKTELVEFCLRNAIDSIVHFQGYKKDWASECSENCFGIVGLGRVAVEGLALGKPVFMLSIFDYPCGLIDEPLYKEAKYANFSGKNLPTVSSSDLINKCLASAYAHPERYNLSKLVRSDYDTGVVAGTILESILEARHTTMSLAEKLIERLSSENPETLLFDSPWLREMMVAVLSGNHYADSALKQMAYLDRGQAGLAFSVRESEARSFKYAAEQAQALLIHMNEIESESRETDDIAGKQIAAHSVQIATLSDRINKLTADVQKQRKRLTSIEKSRSYKIGRMVTAAPRFARDRLIKPVKGRTEQMISNFICKTE